MDRLIEPFPTGKIFYPKNGGLPFLIPETYSTGWMFKTKIRDPFEGLEDDRKATAIAKSTDVVEN